MSHFKSFYRYGEFYFEVRIIYNYRPKGPCKRTPHCWPTSANIVGPTCCVRLHGATTMLALVGTCCVVKFLGPCNWRTQHCWPKTPAKNPQQHATMLWLVASVCMGLRPGCSRYQHDNKPFYRRQNLQMNHSGYIWCVCDFEVSSQSYL